MESGMVIATSPVIMGEGSTALWPTSDQTLVLDLLTHNSLVLLPLVGIYIHSWYFVISRIFLSLSSITA